jgi:hypothetical protein
MFPEVWRRLAGRRHPTRAGVLADFARCALRDGSYPGALPRAGAETRGVLYESVSHALLAKLDRWEGPAYERVLVSVRAGGGLWPAHTYVLTPTSRRRAKDQDWDPKVFQARHLHRWTRLARRFSSRRI